MQLHISARIFGTINCSTHQLTQQGDCSRDTIWIICRNLKFSLWLREKYDLCYCLWMFSGSNFTKRCLVFVPCVGAPFAEVIWIVNDEYLFNTDPSEGLYTSEKRSAPSSFLLFVLLDLLLLGYNEWEMLNFVWAKFKDIRHQLEPSTLMSHLVALHIYFLICLSSPVHGGRMFLAKVCG